MNDPYGVRRVHTDGTGDEMLFPFDMRITTLNVANGTLYICFGLGYEEDGFYISEEIVTLDLATLSKQLNFKMDTEPLCTGPDGWTYFMRYGEGMAWYAMDENGAIHKLG